MKKSKLFLVIGVVFMAIVLYTVYDMSNKTKFPKGKPPQSAMQDSLHMIVDSSAIRTNRKDSLRVD